MSATDKKQTFLIAYSLSNWEGKNGSGRAFAALNREGLPRQSDIQSWEAEIRIKDRLRTVAINSFCLMESEPDECE